VRGIAAVPEFRVSRPLALFLALAAAPALAEPLRFGGINGADDLAGSSELTACRPTTDGLQRCQLARQTFGGLEIAGSEALLNRTGQVRSLRIDLDRADFELARQMLTGRYGAPQASGWTRFDDGARIGMARTARATVISFDFPQNSAAGQPSTRRADWLLPAMIGLGLLLGWLLFRLRRAQPRRAVPVRAQSPMAPMSMRETLERRLREGQEIRF